MEEIEKMTPIQESSPIGQSLRCEIPKPKLPLRQRSPNDVLKVQKVNFENNIDFQDEEELKNFDKENSCLKVERRFPSLSDLYQPQPCDGKKFSENLFRDFI